MSLMFQQFGGRSDIRKQMADGIAQLKKQYTDPGAVIQQMLNTGELTQEDYNKYAQFVRDNFR